MLEVVLARSKSLKVLQGEIQQVAVEIQHYLGGIMEIAGQKPEAKQSLGQRTKSFGKTNTDAVLSHDLKQLLIHVINSLKNYRDRLAHDTWRTLTPRGSIVEGTAQGLGEAHLITTSLDALGLLLEVSQAVCNEIGSIHHTAIKRAMKRTTKLIDEQEVASSISEAMSHLDKDINSRWAWNSVEVLHE